MLKKSVLVLAAIILAFAGYVAVQPAVGHVERSVSIAAPASAIFTLVNDFHQWEAWSPWAKLDPNAKTTFEGPASGKGASFGWSSDSSEVGAGKMTIVESEPSNRIKIDLDFTKPMQSTSVAEFTFKPDGNKTKVTWHMSGERPFFMRAMCILFGAEKMAGAMFEKGLANLDAVAMGKKT